LPGLAVILHGGQSRSRESHNRVFGTCDLNGARVALEAAVVADLQTKGSISRRRLARLDAPSATVTEGFINRVFIIVVVGILFVDFANYTPLERIPRTDLSRWQSHLIGLAGNIEIGRAKLAVSAFWKVVYSPYRRVA
jgi:hypothetical protein